MRHQSMMSIKCQIHKMFLVFKCEKTKGVLCITLNANLASHAKPSTPDTVLLHRRALPFMSVPDTVPY